MRARRLAILTLLGAWPLVPAALAAQESASLAPQWEGRLDASATPDLGAHAGAGVNVRAGWYARLGVSALVGATHDAAGTHASRRLDATARFLLDPFAERRRGLYGGAGLTVRQQGGEAWKGDLLLVVGIEGSTRARLVPAVELALGGGVRLGVVLRSRRGGQSR